MKKTVKNLLCIALVFCFALSVTGCKSLDTKKSNQAFWNNKEKTEIVLNGKIYQQLPVCEYFSPDVISDKATYVTDKDVPVLLAPEFSNGSYMINKEKDIIMLNSGTGYARADKYDQYKKLIKNYKLDHFATNVTYVGSNNEGHHRLCLFSDEEAKTIADALAASTKTPPSQSYEEYGGACDLYLDVCMADESLMFSKYLTSFNLSIKDNVIYFYLDDVSYYIDPAYTDAIASIMAKYTKITITEKQ